MEETDFQLSIKIRNGMNENNSERPAVHNLIEAREHIAADMAKRLPSAEPKSRCYEKDLSCVKEDPFSLRKVPPSKHSRSLVLTAVRRHGNALALASKHWRSDEDIVMEAIKSNAEALRFASDNLRGGQGFVLEAVRQNRDILKFASASLLRDRSFVQRAVEAIEEVENRNVAEPKYCERNTVQLSASKKRF